MNTKLQVVLFPQMRNQGGGRKIYDTAGYAV